VQTPTLDQHSAVSYHRQSSEPGNNALLIKDPCFVENLESNSAGADSKTIQTGTSDAIHLGKAADTDYTESEILFLSNTDVECTGTTGPMAELVPLTVRCSLGILTPQILSQPSQPVASVAPTSLSASDKTLSALSSGRISPSTYTVRALNSASVATRRASLQPPTTTKSFDSRQKQVVVWPWEATMSKSTIQNADLGIRSLHAVTSVPLRNIPNRIEYVLHKSSTTLNYISSSDLDEKVDSRVSAQIHDDADNRGKGKTKLSLWSYLKWGDLF